MTKPKLLLADDSVTIRKVVELTFADEGFDVACASTGEEAMEKFVEFKPDMVIADVHMPEPTGYQICERIKQNEATKHIPVLLVVGSFEPFDQTEAERVGADGFLTKPFQSIRDLIIRVDELIGTQSRAASPAETADIDHLYEQSFLDTSDAEANVDELVDLVMGDAGMDDEIIEMSRPNINGSFEAPKTEESPAADETGSGTPTNGELASSFVGGNIEERRISDSVVVKHLRRKTDIGPGENSAASDEPTDEFVSRVAHRVMEKLSDKVIREIAKEEVPRITERLIREALDEEKK